jgi:hypothetical protein
VDSRGASPVEEPPLGSLYHDSVPVEPELSQIISALQRAGSRSPNAGVLALEAHRKLEQVWAEWLSLRAELDEKVCPRCQTQYKSRSLVNCPACAMPMISLQRAKLLASEARVEELQTKVEYLEEVIIALSNASLSL